MKSRKEVNRNYYLTKIKPHRSLKPPVDVYSCVFCGMMTTLTRLKREEFYQKIYVRAGPKYFKPEQIAKITGLVYGKQKEYWKFMCQRVLSFLKAGIKLGLITKQEIILSLDLKLVRYEGVKKPTYEKSGYYERVFQPSKFDGGEEGIKFIREFKPEF